MLSKDLPATIGRYEVVQEIGRGGMGVVLLGRDPRIGRQVAIKLLDTREEGVAERFLQEARSAGQLRHRNIITIHDCGEINDGSERDGLPFIIMEFIEGTTLAGLIHSNDASLSMSRKLGLIEDLAAGLDYAHNKGVVHRDVKPANVMIDREGVLKILDFGIARVGGSTVKTVDGSMMGTPSYMSPEQAQGRPVDRRSDVFAVGLVLYEILSGRQAFTGTFTRVLYAIASEDPPSLSELCPNLDSDLVTIVNKAIQKDEGRRYQTLADLAWDVALVRARLENRSPNTPLDAIAIDTPRPNAERTPRHLTPREQFARRRSENIEGHLERARRAFEAGDFAAAIAAAEDAELLDPEEPRVIDVLNSARDRLDQQQIGNWLAEAERCLTQRELDQAGALVTKALDLDVRSTAALRMKSLIASARRELEHDADAVAAVERARQRFAGGDPAASLSLLDAFSPPHRLVTQAREELTAELLEQERLARDREEQHRAEAVDRALSAAAAHLARHAWDDASRALTDAEAIDHQNARLLELRNAIAAGRENAWARTKKVTRAVSAAAQSLAAADFDGAERFVEEALAIEPSHSEALAIRSRTADLRAIAARTSEEQERTQREESEARRLAAERARLAPTVIARPHDRGEREPHESATPFLDTYAGEDGRSALSEPEVTPDAGIAKAFVMPPPAPNRPRVGAKVGLALVVVIPMLLLGFWWRGRSSPEQLIPNTSVSNPGDEPRTGTRPTDAAVTPERPADNPIPNPTPDPPAPSPSANQPTKGAVEPPRPAAPNPTTSGTGSKPVTTVAVNNPPAVAPEPPLGAPPTTKPEMAPALPPSAPVTPPEPRESAPAAPPPIAPPPPVAVTTFDRGIANKILAEYVDAMRRLDFAAIKRIYPLVPDSTKVRIEALRKDYSQCDVQFSGFEVVPVIGPTEATVRASGIESCKRKTKQPNVDLPTRYQFKLVKTDAGSWIIGELLTQ